MPGMINARALWKVVRAGHPRARLRATRDGLVAMRLHLGAAAVETGLLDVLAEGDATTARLAERLGAVDEDLLVAFLRVAASVGLLSGGDGRPWHLTARGRAIVDDDLVRASYEAFSGLHTAIYRQMPSMLAGGERRRDVAEHGALIARISQGFEPLVMDVLTRAVIERRPRRVLDIGCGAGLELAAMLEAAPGAHGVGSISTATLPTWPSRPCASAAWPAAPPSSGPTSASPRRGRPGRCPNRSIWPCSPTSSTTCRWPNGFRCSATWPVCSRPAGC